MNYFNPEYAIYRFFQKEDNPTEGLSSPIVGNMLEDKRGHIWICTEGGGLNRFDPEKVLSSGLFIARLPIAFRIIM